MKKTVFRVLAAALVVVMLASIFTACGDSKKKIVIYASSEDFRIENAQKMLNEKFPEYDARIEYMSTGDLSSKLIAEGENTDIDIIWELEATYLEKVSGSLAELTSVDFSVYSDDLVDPEKKYVPLIRSSGSIIINKMMLDEMGIAMPESYDDLLKPEYKGLISMPNPKSSGTGYFFYLNMVNTRGEEAALAYFDELAKNISGAGFTQSGSGPVQALKMGEVAIAMGLTMQAVTEINGGADYEIVAFDEGHPYCAYSSALIKGREDDEDVMKVFNYLINEVNISDKEQFSPEKIFKDRDFTLENYPINMNYADMTGIESIETKESLLGKWKY